MHQNGIDVSVSQFGQQLSRIVELVVVDNGVDRHVDLRLELVGIVAQSGNVVDAVACRSTGAEALCPDVDGIGAVINGRYATLQILGWSQQFQRAYHSISSMLYGVS